jgi:hypothetical protein
VKTRKGLIGAAAVITACSFWTTGAASHVARGSDGEVGMRGQSSPLYYASYGADNPYYARSDVKAYDYSYPYYGYDYEPSPYLKGYLDPGYYFGYGYAPTCHGGFIYGAASHYH